MPPTIHLIRHAEGMHNLSLDNHGLPDPGLTDRGQQQARGLAVRLADLQHANGRAITLVLASPLRRTLMTALAAFDREKHPVIHAWPHMQEVSDLPCDSGSELSAIQGEFGCEVVRYDMLDDGWELKQGKFANTESAVTARAQSARLWLKAQPHLDVAVLSHGCFLHFLTEDWEGSDSPQGTGWGQTEMRSYTFSACDDENDPALFEKSKS